MDETRIKSKEIQLSSRAEMTKEDFDRMMAEGLKQAKEDDSFDVDDVFAELETL